MAETNLREDKINKHCFTFFWAFYSRRGEEAGRATTGQPLGFSSSWRSWCSTASPLDSLVWSRESNHWLTRQNYYIYTPHITISTHNIHPQTGRNDASSATAGGTHWPRVDPLLWVSEDILGHECGVHSGHGAVGGDGPLCGFSCLFRTSMLNWTCGSRSFRQNHCFTHRQSEQTEHQDVSYDVSCFLFPPLHIILLG